MLENKFKMQEMAPKEIILKQTMHCYINIS
jgi:hypothetical protein